MAGAASPLVVAPAVAVLLALYVAIYTPVTPRSLTLPTSDIPHDNILQSVERLGEGLLYGPEDVVFDKDGVMYTATRDGWVRRMFPNGTWQDWRFLGGDAMIGVALSADGSIIVCDADKGLLKVREKEAIILVTDVDGEWIRFADEAIEAADGSIYFSQPTTKFLLHDWFYDVLEAEPHGRLIKYDPSTGKASVVLSDLGFTNGVELSPDQDFLIYCETWRFRCSKYWLKGELAGTTEIFIDNLPGGPDNIHIAPDGSYWIALLEMKSWRINFAHSSPLVKRAIASVRFLVDFVRPIQRRGMVVNVGPDGKIRRSFDDSTGKVLSFVTTAVEYKGHLYLGGLVNKFVGRLRLD